MQRTQVYLREDQQQALHTLTLQSGQKQSELIRQGLDLLIAQKTTAKPNWQAAWQNAAGMWQDHHALDKTLAQHRQQWNQRFQNNGS